MKLTILAGKLKVALGVAKIAASTRSTYGPIFEHILLDADGDLLTLSGTDAEARSWHAVSADINEAGAVALPPKALADFLDVISDGEPVVLTADDRHKAELVSGRTRVRIAGLDPELFPPCPDFGDPLADLTLGADELVGLIGSVAHAAVLTGDSRPELAGILIRAKEHALTLSAADGYRLAYRAVPFDGPDLDVITHARYLLRIAGELKRATYKAATDGGQSGPAARMFARARRRPGVEGFGHQGLEAAGFEVAWQVEIDKDAVSVLERHYPNSQAVPRCPGGQRRRARSRRCSRRRISLPGSLRGWSPSGTGWRAERTVLRGRSHRC
jgi:hypothetical protein